VAALKQELGVKPERRTLELYERIKSDQLPPTDFADSFPTPRDSISPDIVTRLKQLQTILSGVQRRIQRDIKTVEGLLHSENDKL
jgi:hypothetical protein